MTIEDGATVDDASLIGHLNSRGVFTLNRLHVGKGAGMRSFTRLLSGATMEASSRMLEHTLVFAGDSVAAGSTVQGWPSEVVSWNLTAMNEAATFQVNNPMMRDPEGSV